MNNIYIISKLWAKRNIEIDMKMENFVASLLAQIAWFINHIKCSASE